MLALLRVVVHVDNRLLLLPCCFVGLVGVVGVGLVGELVLKRWFGIQGFGVGGVYEGLEWGLEWGLCASIGGWDMEDGDGDRLYEKDGGVDGGVGLVGLDACGLVVEVEMRLLHILEEGREVLVVGLRWLVVACRARELFGAVAMVARAVVVVVVLVGLAGLMLKSSLRWVAGALVVGSLVEEAAVARRVVVDAVWNGSTEVGWCSVRCLLQLVVGRLLVLVWLSS